VDLRKQLLRVETDPTGPGTPGADDAAGGVGEDAVEIEEEG
jgi:hypothetical protein